MTVVTDAFAALGREIAQALGAPALDMTVMPHPLGELSEEKVRERSRQAFPTILTTLRTGSAHAPTGEPDSPPRFLDVEGAYETPDDYFYAHGWTDGLPIVVPTLTRVEQMLARVSRAPDSRVAVIPPRMGIATTEKIAVNCVMAGCAPDHFPVVLAAVEAMCDPRFNLLPMQATTNPVTPLVIVNGPIARRLAINAADNVFGQGWKANATIGRAVRFVLLNLGGGTPGKLDKACHGQPGKYSFCMAENEAASPWPPFHVERGFAPDASTVSVIGVTGTQDVIHYARSNAEQILKTLVNAVPREGFKNLYSGGEPLLVFGPEQAAVLGAAGLSKADVKRAFFERTRVPLELLNEETVVLLKGRRSEQFEGNEPAAVPIADSSDDIQILVAGGSGNHTVFLPTWGDTRCVTVRIEDP